MLHFNKNTLEKIAKWNQKADFIYCDHFCVAFFQGDMNVTFYNFGRITVDYKSQTLEFHDVWDYNNYKDFLANARKFSLN